MPKTFGDLRQLIATEKLAWGPSWRSSDADALPAPSLGGDPTGIPLASSLPAVSFATMLGPSRNPSLTARRLDLGLVTKAEADDALRFATQVKFPLPSTGAAGTPPTGGAPRATALDWRNRFGRNWITTVRDQNPCSACWAFAGTALVEAMLMIESSYWARLSEGDIHKGVGSPCANGNNMGTVSNWVRDQGLADPGCFAWTTADVAYTPTPDRSGRSVRAPAFEWIGSVEDQKVWIDTVGPIVTWLDVHNDFSGYGSGVYRRSTHPSNASRGGHFMLIVGYDDSLAAWLCKNSWGTGFGMNGYIWLAYGDSDCDTYAKCGLRGVNPDPWTKRRLHNGNLYESGNGARHRNLEVVGATGGRVTPRWREGGPPWTWGAAGSFATDAAVCPTLIGTTFSRNMELVYPTTGGRLHHWWRAGGGGAWQDAGVFGPSGVRGPVGFVQSDYGAPGNFEVVVALSSGQLQHVWRDGGGWHNGAVFGTNIAVGGASLVQGQYGTPHGNLEYAATLKNGTMQHFWRSEGDFVWHPGALFGAGVSSAPVMIQGQFGMRDESGRGNLELCVAAGGAVQHWWRNDNGDFAWRCSATFGHDVQAVAGLCQGSWGMNLELVVLRTDGKLQHYWRDGGGWHEGVVIGTA